MRFLILTQYFPPEIGAAQTRLAAFARELQRAGHEVEVVTSMPSYWTNAVQRNEYRRKLYMRDRLNGMTVHRCWSYAANGAGLRRMINYLSFTVTSLIGLCKAKRADCLFVESPPLFLCVPAWIVARITKSKIIFNVADLWPDSVKDLGILKDGFVLRASLALERWAYKQATYVTAVTKGICEAIVAKGVPASKLVFLPNGVDVETFSPRPADKALIERLQIEGKRVLLFAGTHGIAQGLETLVEAARLLHDEPYAFVFVGDGGRKAAVRELAESYKLTNIRFVDAQPLTEMPRYFSIAMASIVPLLKLDLFKSARPSKIFPSLASGVPVIYCGEGEAVTLLTSAGAGIGVEPESPAELAEAIRSLGADSQRRMQLGLNARKLAVDEYSWRSIVSTWLATIRENGGGSGTNGNVVVSGLPFFVGEFFTDASGSVTGWESTRLRFGNRLQSLVSLWKLLRGDVWYSLGALRNGRLFDTVAGWMKKPRVMHWVGSDIAEVQNNPKLIKRFQHANVRHLAETEWNAAELRALGLRPVVAPLPPTRVAAEITPLPEIFTVLFYVPRMRQEFYGARIYERLIADFAEDPVRFLIVGGGTLEVPAGAHVENLGWCSDLENVYPQTTVVVRRTQRDGLSLMVLEALSFGRYAIWPHDHPFVIDAEGYLELRTAFRGLLDRHLAGTLQPQTEAAAYIAETYDRTRALQRIAASWNASRPLKGGRARVTLPT